MTWDCDFHGGPVRGSTRVNGTDQCLCPSCTRLKLVHQTTGLADAMAKQLSDVLRYLDPDDWNNPAEARRQIEFARDSAHQSTHDLRRASGARSLDAPRPRRIED